MSQTIQAAPTASMTIASGQASIFPVAFGYYPAEGSRCVSAQYSWISQTGYAEDLSQLVARGVETTIQSAFIDNSACAQAVTITIAGSEQVIVVPASSQGAFPLFFTGTPAFQITTTGTIAGVTRLYLLNVPINAAGTWGSSAGASSSSLGAYLASPAELANQGTQAALLDIYGAQIVNTEGSAPAFSVVGSQAPAANATDVFVVYGSTTKTCRIHQIILSFTATAAIGSLAVSIYQRTGFNSGGTNSFGSPVAHNPSLSATLQYRIYSANPTGLGSSPGPLEQFYVGGPALAINPIILNYGPAGGDQSLIIPANSTNTLAVNLEGQSIPAGLVMRCKMKWTEV